MGVTANVVQMSSNTVLGATMFATVLLNARPSIGT